MNLCTCIYEQSICEYEDDNYFVAISYVQGITEVTALPGMLAYARKPYGKGHFTKTEIPNAGGGESE